MLFLLGITTAGTLAWLTGSDVTFYLITGLTISGKFARYFMSSEHEWNRPTWLRNNTFYITLSMFNTVCFFIILIWIPINLLTFALRAILQIDDVAWFFRSDMQRCEIIM
jgi:hypothetical protein